MMPVQEPVITSGPPEAPVDKDPRQAKLAAIPPRQTAGDPPEEESRASRLHRAARKRTAATDDAENFVQAIGTPPEKKRIVSGRLVLVSAEHGVLNFQKVEKSAIPVVKQNEIRPRRSRRGQNRPPGVDPWLVDSNEADSGGSSEVDSSSGNNKDE
jgi:hypothetical protein